MALILVKDKGIGAKVAVMASFAIAVVVATVQNEIERGKKSGERLLLPAPRKSMFAVNPNSHTYLFPTLTSYMAPHPTRAPLGRGKGYEGAIEVRDDMRAYTPLGGFGRIWGRTWNNLMTNLEIIKQLFQSFNNDDRDAFMEAAREYIERQKRKKHTIFVS